MSGALARCQGWWTGGIIGISLDCEGRVDCRADFALAERLSAGAVLGDAADNGPVFPFVALRAGSWD